MDTEVERELREVGAADDLVPELAELAREIEQLPAVAPRRSWLVEARWRLLRRFDAEQAESAPADPTPPQ